MTLIYKDFTIEGTVEEIKELIELMENKNSTITITSNLDRPSLEKYTKSKEYNSIDKSLYSDLKVKVEKC